MGRNKLKLYQRTGDEKAQLDPIVFDDLEDEVTDTVEVSRGPGRPPGFIRSRARLMEKDRERYEGPRRGAFQRGKEEGVEETRRPKPLKLLFAAALAVTVVVVGSLYLFWERGAIPKKFTDFKEQVFEHTDGTVTMALDPFLFPERSGKKRLRIVPMEMIVKRNGIHDVQSQIAAVRSVIFIHVRAGGSGDAFSKESIRKMTELINNRIGSQAVVKVRIPA